MRMENGIVRVLLYNNSMYLDKYYTRNYSHELRESFLENNNPKLTSYYWVLE